VSQLADLFQAKLLQDGKDPETGARRLRPGEGDNVDKACDMVDAIKEHLDAVVPLVDDGQMEQVEIHAKAIEHLAQALQFLVREMDVENG